jgi:hypothetical protein
VHEKGVVTMIPPPVSTQITFSADGSFVRISKSPGKRDFKDSGQFIIEEPDQLTLRIVMSAGKVQTSPVDKHHQFSLSPDGTELKLTAPSGKVAVFRK